MDIHAKIGTFAANAFSTEKPRFFCGTRYFTSVVVKYYRLAKTSFYIITRRENGFPHERTVRNVAKY